MGDHIKVIKKNLCSKNALMACVFVLFAAQAVFPDPEIVNPSETLVIKSFDDVGLATDIYLPESGGTFPCVLIRTPYNRKNVLSDAEFFTGLGYAVVIQDTRGKYESEGTFYPFKYERQDGLATIDWIKAQSWSNGKIGGWGGSYGGYTQWAVADRLDAMVPLITSANMYELVYPNGIFSLATSFNWNFWVDSKTVNEITPDKMTAAYSIRPLSTADNSTYGQNDFMDDVLEHQCEDAYWGALNHRSAESCPMFSIAGWYDIFLMGQINDFIDPASRRHPQSRLLIGPYAHGSILIDTDFGDHGDLYKFKDEAVAFLAEHLKEENPPSKQPLNDKPYSLFIEHRNQWYDAQEWPPEKSKPTPYYLGSKGTVSILKPAEDSQLEFLYNPKTPFPSLGGSFFGKGAGPAYQNENIEREDQLVFESDPLGEELILLGPVDATIYVGTGAPSTDFFVSLQDVRPDGKIVNIQEGGKTIFTDGNSDGRIQGVDISLWAAGYQINPGHKIRLVITSSLFPRYNCNLNSGEAIFSAEHAQPALQKVYFGKKYPSHIRLPILQMK